MEQHLWRLFSLLFLILVWVVCAITYSLEGDDSGDLRVSPLHVIILMVSPFVLLLVFLLQSFLFLHLQTKPRLRFCIKVALSLLHEILYPRLHQNLLLPLAFSFKACCVICHFRSLNHANLGLVKLILMHNLRSIYRSFVHEDYMEAGTLILPVIVAFTALYVGNNGLQTVASSKRRQ